LPPPNETPTPDLIDSRTAWIRLAATLAIMTVGASGMYVVPVVLPAVQADFGVARADASLPYTLLMIGFGVGGILMGRLADRFGVAVPLRIGAISLGLGFAMAALAGNIWVFAIAHGLLIGLVWLLGHVFTAARRHIAVVCAAPRHCGGHLRQWQLPGRHHLATYRAVFCAGPSAGARPTWAWPPSAASPCFCWPSACASGHPLCRRPPPSAPRGGRACTRAWPTGHSACLRTPPWLLLSVAGVACCVAMSMPQVHIVAYCADLGYGAARGAEMLSLMLACGIVSRLISGMICDRIGGLRTLLLGSVLQGMALVMFLPFDGLVPLYVISALFGLFQGGIVPSYAIIVREYFAPATAGAKVGTVIMCTMLGMALGRLDVGQGVRPDRQLPCGLHQRRGLESAELWHRVFPDATHPAQRQIRSSVAKPCPCPVDC
jgi:MFS family permease